MLCKLQLTWHTPRGDDKLHNKDVDMINHIDKIIAV